MRQRGWRPVSATMLEYVRVRVCCKHSHPEPFMTVLPIRATALVAAAGSLLLVTVPAVRALDAWMTEAAMRAAFIGKTLDGHYGNGVAWTETYLDNGRLDYRENRRRAVGNWHF